MARPDDPGQQGPYLNVAGERDRTAQPQFRDFGLTQAGAQSPMLTSAGAMMPITPTGGLAVQPLGMPASSLMSTMISSGFNPAVPINPLAQAQQIRMLQQEMMISTERIASYLSTAADKAELLSKAGEAAPETKRHRHLREVEEVAGGAVVGDLIGRAQQSRRDSGQSDPENPIDRVHRENREARDRDAGRSGGHRRSPASEGRVRTTTQIEQEAGVEGEPVVRSLHDLRRQAVRGINRRISEMHFGPTLEQDEQGVYRYAQTGLRAGEEGLAGTEAAPEAVSAFTRGQKVSGIIQNVVGGLEGAGPLEALQGALPEAGLAAAAPLLAFEGARRIKDFANAQRAANANWQRMLGGSNAEGFGERAGEQLFKWQQNWFGGMSGEQAGQLYEGSAAIFGRDRGARKTAMDFGVDAWNQFGMTVQQSLALVRVEAESGNVSLTNLSKSLRTVTDAARDAGVNAEDMVKKFQTNLSAVGTEVMGAGGPAVAGAQTAFQAALGNRFQGLDLSGLSSDQAIMIQSSQAHMTRAQFLAKSASDPTFLASQQAQQMRTIGSQVLASRPGALQWLSQQKATGQGDWERIGRELQQRFNIDPTVVSQIFAAQGITGLTNANAVNFLAQSLSPNADLGDRAAKIVGDATARPLPQGATATGDWGKQQATALGITTTMRPGAGDPNTDRGRKIQSAMNDYASGHIDYQAYYDRTKDLMNPGDLTRSLVMMQEQKTGKTNPLAEKLVKDTKDYDKFKWRVQTKDGEQIVDTGHLMSYYMDQVAAGTATVAEGPKEAIGETVAQVTGMPGDQGAQVTSDQAGAAPGSKKASDEKDQGGTVTIDLKPPLDRYFRILTHGNVQQSQQQGVPTPGKQDQNNFGGG